MEPLLAVYPVAKINLGLHIVGKRADGYHLLETVFIPVPHLHDELSIYPTKGGDTPTLHCTGINLGGKAEDNLIIKAWYLFKDKYPNLPAYHFELNKIIPAGAGLGGGSSDAAFVCNALNFLQGNVLSIHTLKEITSSLGADVSFFLDPNPQFATGIGNVLTEIPIVLPGRIKVVLSPIHSNTKEAYNDLRYDLCHTDVDLYKSVLMPSSTWKENIFNDFEPSIFQKYPLLAKVKSDLYAEGAVYASLSGSGSAVYGIFNA
jgi:4-diphosphocytidyl-2-C-methyl-D-erythritol kinase